MVVDWTPEERVSSSPKKQQQQQTNQKQTKNNQTNEKDRNVTGHQSICERCR